MRSTLFLSVMLFGLCASKIAFSADEAEPLFKMLRSVYEPRNSFTIKQVLFKFGVASKESFAKFEKLDEKDIETALNALETGDSPRFLSSNLGRLYSECMSTPSPTGKVKASGLFMAETYYVDSSSKWRKNGCYYTDFSNPIYSTDGRESFTDFENDASEKRIDHKKRKIIARTNIDFPFMASDAFEPFWRELLPESEYRGDISVSSIEDGIIKISFKRGQRNRTMLFSRKTQGVVSFKMMSEELPDSYAEDVVLSSQDFNGFCYPRIVRTISFYPNASSLHPDFPNFEDGMVSFEIFTFSKGTPAGILDFNVKDYPGYKIEYGKK